jgi:hypothetical protein
VCHFTFRLFFSSTSENLSSTQIVILMKHALDLFEDDSRLFLSSLPAPSSPWPCLFGVKTWILSDAFRSLMRMLGQTRFAVHWLTCCRPERDQGSYATVGTFNFEHVFLRHLESSLLVRSPQRHNLQTQPLLQQRHSRPHHLRAYQVHLQQALLWVLHQHLRPRCLQTLLLHFLRLYSQPLQLNRHGQVTAWIYQIIHIW